MAYFRLNAFTIPLVLALLQRGEWSTNDVLLAEFRILYHRRAGWLLLCVYLSPSDLVYIYTISSAVPLTIYLHILYTLRHIWSVSRSGNRSTSWREWHEGIRSGNGNVRKWFHSHWSSLWRSGRCCCRCVLRQQEPDFSWCIRNSEWHWVSLSAWSWLYSIII